MLEPIRDTLTVERHEVLGPLAFQSFDGVIYELKTTDLPPKAILEIIQLILHVQRSVNLDLHKIMEKHDLAQYFRRIPDASPADPS